VLPMYFGTAQRRLYGVYHPPTGGGDREEGVLLCYPSVQEYMRTHFAFRKLAGLLTQEGFHVLRFDYFGTGDSAGDIRDASPAEWCLNVRQAREELRDQAGVSRVSVVGLRLGAALATVAATSDMDVRDLVLWEPVLDGDVHLEDLRRIEQRMLALLRVSLQRPLRTGSDELLGYPLPRTLSAAIQKIDLRSLSRCRANRVLIFGSRDRESYRILRDTLRDRSGNPPRYTVVPDETNSRATATLLSTNILRAMTAALARRTN
jgi:uncharacterized protein